MKLPVKWMLAAAAGIYCAGAGAQDNTPDAELLASCDVCHGEAGVSPSDEWPHLAGQPAAYLAQEMREYRDGTRVNAEMNALSSILSDEQIDALATHYAAFPPANPDISGFSEEALAGRNFVGTCIGCHGMEGISVVDVWPSLAGQTRPYLESQLKAFRDGDRYDTVMSGRAVALTDEQIEAIAGYFSSMKHPGKD